MASVPERLAWAVRVLDVRPDDEILEIGGGPGAAAALVCERLTGGGRLVGIDRSPVAVRRARERNAVHVATGRAVFRQASLEEYDGDEATFDKVFAVNVNLFWTQPGCRGLAVIRHVLRPGGALHLFWDCPSGTEKAERIAKTVTAALTANGFITSVASSPFALGLTAGVAAA